MAKHTSQSVYLDRHGPPAKARTTRRGRPLHAAIIVLAAASILLTTADPLQAKAGDDGNSIVITQLPVDTPAEIRRPRADGMLRADFGDGARLIILHPNLSTNVVSEGFHGACDPDVSFDGSHILFAGKRKAGDNWDIFEMAADGSDIRQITNGLGDCRSPAYQGKLYTIVSAEPWYQLTFVAAEKDAVNEYGVAPATSLYSCRRDGSEVRRLTFNLSSDMDPFVKPDGRLLFAGWQRATLDRGPLGRIALFGVNIDGTDYAAFCADEGLRIKHMPCTTTKGLAVFVEAETLPWDGAGTLSCVRLRRPLHSYRRITGEPDGLYHSPYPLPNGDILVSRRSPDNTDTHAVGRLDPTTGQFTMLFDDPACHDIQAKLIGPRSEPDGRSSVVTESDPNAKLYCLNVHIAADSPSPSLGRMAARLRILEGIAPTQAGSRQQIAGPVSLAQRRILGEITIEKDGSFNIEVPANTPIELQTLDADGMALQTCSWIWARNREPRGCIGCHEDGELTPENELVDAVKRPAVNCAIAPRLRRTVAFKRDIMPVITRKCARCHSDAGASLRLAPDAAQKPLADSAIWRSLLVDAGTDQRGKYVHPGHARTSPLIWHILGRNTSKPWDTTFSDKPVKRMPPGKLTELTEDEKRTFIEWIDMGAAFDCGQDR